MCEHLVALERPRAHPVTPSADGCEECLRAGTRWVHLRLCLTCGHVGCCDSSPERHATGHFHATQHPVIKSYEPGEGWAWCFVHGAFAEAIPAFAAESPHGHLG
jgi:hypothetical protein